MKVNYNNKKREKQELDVKDITVQLNEDVEFRISINNCGELEIQKANFGQGNSGIVIQPSVSNEIRIT